MNNKLYKLLTGATLFLPIPIYLIISVALFSITPDVIVNGKVEDAIVEKYNDDYFVHFNDFDITFEGYVMYNEEIGKYGILIDEETIIKFGWKFYRYEKDNFVDINTMELQKEVSYKIPIIISVSIVGVVIVILIITKKMGYFKTHPRFAVFMSLLVGTIILALIESVVASLLNVFIVSLSSWIAYCIEYNIQNGIINSKTALKEKSEIERKLEGYIK